jgi:hypothetical protein
VSACVAGQFLNHGVTGSWDGQARTSQRLLVVPANAIQRITRTKSRYRIASGADVLEDEEISVRAIQIPPLSDQRRKELAEELRRYGLWRCESLVNT